MNNVFSSATVKLLQRFLNTTTLLSKLDFDSIFKLFYNSSVDLASWSVISLKEYNVLANKFIHENDFYFTHSTVISKYAFKEIYKNYFMIVFY